MEDCFDRILLLYGLIDKYIDQAACFFKANLDHSVNDAEFDERSETEEARKADFWTVQSIRSLM